MVISLFLFVNIFPYLYLLYVFLPFQSSFSFYWLSFIFFCVFLLFWINTFLPSLPCLPWWNTINIFPFFTSSVHGNISKQIIFCDSFFFGLDIFSLHFSLISWQISHFNSVTVRFPRQIFYSLFFSLSWCFPLPRETNFHCFLDTVSLLPSLPLLFHWQINFHALFSLTYFPILASASHAFSFPHETFFGSLFLCCFLIKLSLIKLSLTHIPILF